MPAADAQRWWIRPGPYLRRAFSLAGQTGTKGVSKDRTDCVRATSSNSLAVSLQEGDPEEESRRAARTSK